MNSNSDSLLNDVLALPVNERIEVVEKLLQSLDVPNRQIEEVWAREADIRVENFDNGRLDSVSAEDVLKKYK